MISSHLDRISQDLPVPKCSTCGQFVPLEQLGDHICPLPPPPTKPVSTLPLKHLQSPPLAVPSTSRSASPPSRRPSNSPTKATFQRRPSALATESQPTNAGPSRDMPSRQGTPSNAAQTATTTTTRTSPRPILHPRPVAPTGQSSPVQGHSGTPIGYRGTPRGSPISRSDTPTRLLPGNMVPRDTALPRSGSPSSILPRNPHDMSSSAPQRTVKFSTGPGVVIPEVHPPQRSFVPPPERGIDTKIGGEAGMAGVGRRGFAAIARAAMLAGPPSRSLEPQQVHRKPNQPKYLDLDAVSLCALF